MSRPKETFEDIEREFDTLVNMSPKELHRWLETGDSAAVGWHHDGEGESVGHQSGRRIIEILETSPAKLQESDRSHMRKVVGYIKRHLAQPPHHAIEHTRWRYSLMNWGHDPLKDGGA